MRIASHHATHYMARLTPKNKTIGQVDRVIPMSATCLKVNSEIFVRTDFSILFCHSSTNIKDESQTERAFEEFALTRVSKEKLDEAEKQMLDWQRMRFCCKDWYKAGRLFSR